MKTGFPVNCKILCCFVFFCHLQESSVLKDQNLTFLKNGVQSGKVWKCHPVCRRVNVKNCIFWKQKQRCLATLTDSCYCCKRRSAWNFLLLLHYNEQQTIVEIDTRWSWINCVPSENKHNKNYLRLFSFHLLICNLSWIGRLRYWTRKPKWPKCRWNLTATTASQPHCGALRPFIPK